MCDLSINGVTRLLSLVQTGRIEESFIFQIVNIKEGKSPRGTAIAVRVSDGEHHTLVIVEPSLNKYVESGMLK